MSLTGKKVVIIGGSAGIGKATARAAVAQGAEVVIGSRDEAHLQEAQDEIGGGVKYCVMDVRDVRGMDYCFDQIGPFDHLVVTAVEVTATPFIQMELDAARHVFEVKFWGQFAAAQLAAPSLREGGSITLFSGVAAHKPVRGFAAIAAANGAVEALVRSLALEISPLRVNAVSPGFIDTHGIDPERRTKIAEALPARCVGEADHAAQAVLFLMQNPYTTGTVLYVDGGNRIV